MGSSENKLDIQSIVAILAVVGTVAASCIALYMRIVKTEELLSELNQSILNIEERNRDVGASAIHRLGLLETRFDTHLKYICKDTEGCE